MALKKVILYILFCFVLINTTFVFPFKKNEKEEINSETNNVEDENYIPSSSDITILPLLPKKNVFYFSSIDEKILKLFEKGDSDSLLKAISSLKKNNSIYTEQERVLIYIAKNIMQMCWTSVPVFDIPNVSVSDLMGIVYVSSIDFAKDCIYDFTTGDSDFFCLVLPSLVLLSSSVNSDCFELSRKSLLTALERYPDSILVQYLLGVLYEKLEDYSQSCIYLEKAASSNNFDILYRLSTNYLKNKEFEKSKNIAEEVLKNQPTQAIKLFKLCAESSFLMNDLKNAELYVSKILQLEPENSDYILFRAKIMVKKGDYIRAASLLDSYSKINDETKDYLLLRSYIQNVWNRNTKSSAYTLEKAITLYPSDLDVLLACSKLSSSANIKIANLSSDDYAKIILSIEPDNIDAKKVQIDNLIQKRDWESAYKISYELYEKMKNELDFFNLKNENESEKIIENEKREIVIDSIFFTHIKICISIKTANRKNEAWKIVSKLYELEPEDENVIQLYLSVLISMNRKKEASKLIEEYLPTSSSKMKSFLFYQKSFIDSKEDIVISDLRSSLTTNPRNTDTLYKLYKIYYDKKEYRKAQFYLKQVVALSPNDADIRNLSLKLDDIVKNAH